MNRLYHLKRYAAVINKLTNIQYVSKEELLAAVKESCDGHEPDIRTLQRDFAAIYEIFGVSIKFERGRGYCIADKDEVSETLMNLLSDFLVVSSLGQEPGIDEIILPEKRRMIFSVSITSVIKAVKDCRTIEFDYSYFREGERIRHKIVDPYFLKESQQRWYLVAIDHKDKKLKCFGLDRILNLDISSTRFHKNLKLNVPELFRQSFGIWNDPETPVEEIVLRYDSLDGSFIKSLPLHSSQKVVAEDDNSLTVSLHLRITNDFVMAVLSRSRSVEVIKPLHLRQRIHEILKQALDRNRVEDAGNDRGA